MDPCSPFSEEKDIAPQCFEYIAAKNVIFILILDRSHNLIGENYDTTIDKLSMKTCWTHSISGENNS